MPFNLNKILKLQIRGKLAVAFAGLSILPVIIIGLLGLTINVRTLRQVAVEDLNHDLWTIKERLSAFLTSTEENIELLAGSASFQKFINSVIAQDTLAISSALKDLQPDLINFAQRREKYYQIKFIDTRGDEFFIIEKDHRDEYRMLPASELNRAGTSFYVIFIRENPPDKAVFLPVELIKRDSKTLLPCISCVYPVREPEFTGILIFQLHAQALFDVMEQKTPHGPSGQVALVNSEGYYLYHSLIKKDWNRLLASKDVLNLQTEYGEEIAMELLSPSSGSLLEIGDKIVAHAPLFDKHEGLGGYILLTSVSKEMIFAPAKTFTKIFIVLSGFFLVISLILAYLATHQFTRPIEKLRRETSVIARGDYHARVDVKTYDEIEDLAEQFNIMAESLEQREAEIQRHSEKLEQRVQLRTKELRSEKDKLQAILDNVPSGFILLDRNYNILSASAALESITGKSVKDILGRRCYDILGDSRTCPDCPNDVTFQTGKMHTQLNHHISAEGEDRYLEHISVPLTKNGRVEQVLEIITDVTERKHLQEQLVRSERLAATGEMAAVIAHEMRNSLTSMRMILQLLSKNEYISVSEVESLDVALDSVNRMERVVKDLLQLARPSGLTKKASDVNAIIKDCIEIARHEIEKRSIRLNIELASNLPTLELDGNHIKEAMVNLLLNAAQANESKGHIEIRTTSKTLKRTFRQLGEVPIVSGETTTLEVKEVVLKKSARVVQIDVEDSGCGISKEHFDRIFDPFYTTKIEGTGLGLSFVKRVVSEHGGIVSVTTEVGKGSCFSIFLPV
ncbi:MAG: ATP-binding protein [bacterium]